MFGVFLKGSSIGTNFKVVTNLDEPVNTFDNKEDAKACAKRMRKQLTIGERNYYRMSYITRQL